MCIGGQMKDCPPGILTSEELAEIKKLPTTRYGKTLYTLAAGYYEEASPWQYRSLRGMVLRNLAKRVYVRRDVVEEELRLNIGDLAMYCLPICWSAGSCEMEVDITRGAWAGDRLDVVPFSVVENNEEREDVTEDQVKLTRFALDRSM
ncbi:uncharacterized protein EV420DRAFT_1730367 [Desarmillaria tabescens]|uniref:Uncharacterized protein n=1 Tax=Armillaria tabescens TaxID=1929756 RepID=A0AA39JF54_ARMTA|nr:uncharacterized protein EV420DRAFT_1730367 [Desarmillaria tabescens]KAK0441269.1 hypothetical protein EV420DRAFT_1730367 [Desarmillaria tabescens]